MNSWARKSVKVGLLSAGFLLAGTAAAHASTDTTANNAGRLNGAQVDAKIQAPIDVCGNAITVLGGTSSAWCTGGPTATLGAASGGTSAHRAHRHHKHVEDLPLVGHLLDNLTSGLTGASGALTGTPDASAPAPMPMHTRPVAYGYGSHPGGGTCTGTTLTTSNNSGIANGAQVYEPIQMPIDISGNAIGVGGNAFAYSTGGATSTLC